MAAELPVPVEGSDPSALSIISDTDLEIRTESFTCFPRLPPELKLRIWELAVPTSRIITALANPRRPKSGFAMLRDTELHLLHACHDSRATVLKTSLVRHFPEMGRPFHVNPTSDAFMIVGRSIARFFNSELKSSMRGITRILGVSYGTCSSYHYRQNEDPRDRTHESRQRSSRLYNPLWNLIENIGTLDRLIVLLPACYTPPTQEEAVKVLQNKRQSSLVQTSEGHTRNEIPYTVPTITFKTYDCSLDAHEIKSKLRKAMEVQIEDL